MKMQFRFFCAANKPFSFFVFGLLTGNGSAFVPLSFLYVLPFGEEEEKVRAPSSFFLGNGRAWEKKGVKRGGRDRVALSLLDRPWCYRPPSDGLPNPTFPHPLSTIPPCYKICHVFRFCKMKLQSFLTLIVLYCSAVNLFDYNIILGESKTRKPLALQWWYEGGPFPSSSSYLHLLPSASHSKGINGRPFVKQMGGGGGVRKKVWKGAA